VLSLVAFCRQTRISLRTFHTLTKRGEAPATVRIGRRRLVRKKTADAWLLAHEAT
jgi:hypothetical protein